VNSTSAHAGPTLVAEHRVRASDGVELACLVTGGEGPGPPLVLLNSLGTDRTMWDEVLPALTASRPVVRFDARGHGASEVPPGPYTLERLVDDVHDVARALHLDAVDLCGCSLGGLVALGAVVRRASWVRRVVVSNSAAHFGTAEAWEQRARTVEASGMTTIADTVLQRFLSPAFRDTEVARADELRQRLVDTPVAGYAASCRALAQADLRPGLASVAAPVLVVAGQDDVAVPAAVSLEVAEAVQDGSAVLLPGGHLSSVEQPAAFTTAVLEHLDVYQRNRST